MIERNKITETTKKWINETYGKNKTPTDDIPLDDKDFDRKLEIKFFNLVRSYNKIIYPEELHFKEIAYIFDEIDIKVRSVSGDGENGGNESELTKHITTFKNDVKNIFANYLALKYGETYLKYKYYSSKMRSEVKEFNKKLELICERESFYSRDFSKFTESIEKCNTLEDLKNEYSDDQLLEAIKYLITYPFSIENGYLQLVTHVNEKYIKYDDSKPINQEINMKEYDELTTKQKAIINDIIIESYIDLKEMQYSDKIGYDVLKDYWFEFRKDALTTIEPIYKYYSSKFKFQRAPVKQMPRPKKFLHSTGKRKEKLIDENNEVVFYMDKDNKIKQAVASKLYFHRGEFSKVKNEYILPGEPENAYIASTMEYKSKTSTKSLSLPKGQEFIAKDENGEYTLVETDRTGKIINNDEDITNKKLYSCEKVDVEYSKLLIPDYIEKDGSIETEQKIKSFEYENGIVFSRLDDDYLEFEFKNGIKYKGLTKPIDENENECQDIVTEPDDTHKKTKKPEIKIKKIKNFFKKF